MHTPLIQSAHFPGVYYKAESFQPIGSFKIRGAYNRIAALPESERDGGVIAYSSGNHAQGVAYAARALGIPAIIVMPTNAPSIKIEATRGYGATVVLYDPLSENREEVTARLMDGHAWVLVPPFNDPHVIAGQGTMGLEIVGDLPDVDTVLVPIGGGGMISGIATAIRALKPGVRIIGVEPEMADDARQSFERGQIVTLSAAQTGRTLADGVRTLALGDLTFAHIRTLVDQIVTVSEAELRAAARHIILNEHLITEPTGALPLAAWLRYRERWPDARKVVLIVSGGNIDPITLRELIG